MILNLPSVDVLYTLNKKELIITMVKPRLMMKATTHKKYDIEVLISIIHVKRMDEENRIMWMNALEKEMHNVSL